VIANSPDDQAATMFGDAAEPVMPVVLVRATVPVVRCTNLSSNVYDPELKSIRLPSRSDHATANDGVSWSAL
jgi:hypothetical protein